ncbi:MAG: cobalamin-binding protein [Cyanobacteria bacterium P01_A01_bin.105]
MSSVPPTPTPLRIVSLIPSATEIVAALGYGSALVGRSHECDYPHKVQTLPACTAPRFNPEGTSRAIHDRVTELLTSALSVYEVKVSTLAQLRPTHIITQAQCEVCAASLDEVQKAVECGLETQPQVISLQPQVLADIWADLERVATALDPQDGQARASRVIHALQQRLQHCTQPLSDLPPHPTVACIEWTDPLMAAGNWVPELVTLAGGHCLFGKIGQHSPWLQWDELLAADPDLIVVMPCGYDLLKTQKAVEALSQDPHWADLRAVRNYRVYLTDGNQYFNRPGPRLVDSVEILAEILQPEAYEAAAGQSYAMAAWKLFSL